MSPQPLRPHHQPHSAERPWYMQAVFYEVDVKSFQDSDGDGLGDLRGLLSRLPYLQELGVDALWLQPIYPSPKRDNGYDVSDYCAVDPALGTLDDFRAVVRRAGELGIRVLLDLPLNHTSDEHPWFREARGNPASPYRAYYIWADRKPENPAPYPVFGEAQGDNWAWDEAAGQYYFHSFYPFRAYPESRRGGATGASLRQMMREAAR